MRADLGQHLQALTSSQSLRGGHGVTDRDDGFFAVPDDEGVDERRHRLRVEGSVSPGDDDGIARGIGKLIDASGLEPAVERDFRGGLAILRRRKRPGAARNRPLLAVGTIACWTVIWISLSRRTCKPGPGFPRNGRRDGEI